MIGDRITCLRPSNLPSPCGEVGTSLPERVIRQQQTQEFLPENDLKLLQERNIVLGWSRIRQAVIINHV